MSEYQAHAALRDTARQTAADNARIEADRARTAAQREQLARYAAIKASRKVAVVGRIVAWVKGVTA